MADSPKYSRILPITQVVITAILTFWSDRVDWILIDNSRRAPGRFARADLIAIQAKNIWRGVNAPTFPLCFAGLSKYQLLGFGVGELMYFAAVALLWFYVGRFFDRRTDSTPPEPVRIGGRKKVSFVLVIAWGLFLLVGNLWTIREQFELIVRPDVAIQRALFLLWSLILITVPAVKLARVR